MSLIPLYREMAETGDNFQGLSILKHSDAIGRLVRAYKARTLLDYGCGRGDAYHSPHKVYRQWGLKRSDVALYDPAFKKHEILPPRRFDAVLCSDVLEHIPEPDLDPFIADLFNHAKKFVWASVCCRPAKKTFPDGTNLHVTVAPFEWWQDRFKRLGRGGGIDFHLVETP